MSLGSTTKEQLASFGETKTPTVRSGRQREAPEMGLYFCAIVVVPRRTRGRNHWEEE